MSAMFNARAFSILEIIAALLLMTVIVAIGISPYITQQEFLKRQFARTRLHDDLSLSMLYISNDIFRAKSITITGLLQDEISIIIPTNAANSNEIVTIDYSLDADKRRIIRKIDSAEQYITFDPSTYNPAIYTLHFESIADNFVLVTITGIKQDQTITLQTGIALRATSTT